MKMPFRKAKPPMFDFSHAVEAFASNLEELANHIESHAMVEDYQRTASQARVAAQMLRHANDFEGPPSPPWEGMSDEDRSAWSKTYLEEEDAAWADAWAYVGKHIRKWWD